MQSCRKLLEAMKTEQSTLLISFLNGKRKPGLSHHQSQLIGYAHKSW